jgi:hypothetical protein
VSAPEPSPQSEYDGLFGDPDEEERSAAEAVAVRRAFRTAASPYLSTPLPWFCWALVLPAAALLTPLALAFAREAGVVILWSGAILVGGSIEGVTILRRRSRRGRSSLGAWAMRAQGNLSLVAVLLSGLLIWLDAARFLPGLWLLLLGHNLYSLGGLAFAPMRAAGMVYQLGGLVALIPGSPPLWAMAAATAFGNAWIGWGILRSRPEEGAPQPAEERGSGSS